MIFIDSIEDTPLGTIWVAQSQNGIVSITDSKEKCTQITKKLTTEIQIIQDEKINDSKDQIREYLNGKRKKFDLLIDETILTPFQRMVLSYVMQIPYGTTKSYKEIAHSIGLPKAARAVARANATNPVLLLIPCHRVISSTGSLQGYSAFHGIETKRWLLEMEKLHC